MATTKPKGALWGPTGPNYAAGTKLGSSKTGKAGAARAPVKQLKPLPARKPGEVKPVAVKPFDSGAINAPVVVRKPAEPPPYQGPTLAQQTAYLPGGSMNTSPITGPIYTGSHGGVGGNTTSPLTGFARNWVPEARAQVEAQPELILQKLMELRGQDPLGAGTGMMALGTPYMDALSAIMPLTWGGANPPTPSSAINWMAKMGQEGMTPGGAAIDFRDVVRAIGNLDPQSSAAQSMWGVGVDPQSQVNATKQMVYGAAQGGLPAFFQRAVQNMMNQQALAYMQNQYTGGTPATFQQFLPDFY